ncbi:hypothetical protein M3Y95_00280000 [Aphelenchoides besseyi]|nr:hypothetical protein M3Y95_00280000 [Aphelenchoides besseyi]
MKRSTVEYQNATGTIPNVAEEVVLDDRNNDNTKEAAAQPSAPYACNEELDDNKVTRAAFPGALEHDRDSLAHIPFKRQAHRFRTELEPEDVRLVNELGQLSADQLMEYLRKIKDMACALGQAQEEQCVRGKFIRVFKP